MLNNDQMHALFLRVMDSMVRSGWLHSHTFTDGKGYHLVWAGPGAQRAAILKRIIAAFELLKVERAPMGFDILAHGDRLPDWVKPEELNAETASFWCQCVGELGLRRDEDGLLAFVHIIHGWAPDLDTPVKIDGLPWV